MLPYYGMSLDFDIRFDLKSISSHARKGCCSQPGASLEINFKSLNGGMSRQCRDLKSILSLFWCILQGQLEIEFKSSTPASMLLAATTSCLALFKGPLSLKGTVSLLVIPKFSRNPYTLMPIP